jgi:hypothetical protein
MADYVYHLVYYMFVAGCRFDNFDHFINFIGIEARVDPSATTPLNVGDVATSHDVAPLFTSVLSSLRAERIVAPAVPRMMCSVHSLCYGRQVPLQL